MILTVQNYLLTERLLTFSGRGLRHSIFASESMRTHVHLRSSAAKKSIDLSFMLDNINCLNPAENFAYRTNSVFIEIRSERS